MRTRFFFKNKPQREPHPFRTKSTWLPPKNNPILEEYLTKTKQLVLSPIPSIQTHQQNLTTEERQALTFLKNNQQIIIKTADKGSGIVLENKSDYIHNGLKHLSNRKIYLPLPADPTSSIANEINHSIEALHEAGYLDDTTKEFLTLPEQVRTQRIYFLKKIHKNPFGIRPIVSGINGPTEKISAYLDYYLKPALSNIPTLLNNSQDLTIILENTSIPQDALLLTIDVSNLYLNIPQDEGTAACIKALQETNNLPIPKHHLEQLFDFVLKENVFSFNDKVFKQIQGTAMGTKMAPSYANIFMHEIEQGFLQTQTIKPLVWKRYIDDIFVIWTANQTQLDDFLLKLNQYHHTIKFTSETSQTSVNFLDMTIYKGHNFTQTNKLDYKTYFKPTNTFQYLHFKSAHTKNTKTAVIKGETKRFQRTNSEKPNYEQTIEQFKHHLISRGYPTHLITESILNAQTTNSNPKPTQSTTPIILVTSLSNSTTSLNLKLRHHWDIIQNDPSLTTVFTDQPTVTFRKTKTISNTLVRAKLPDDPDKHLDYIPTPAIRIPSRTPICGHWNCKTCPKLLPLRQLNGYPLVQNLNCKSQNVIYAIQCNICRKLYIGQTNKCLHLRITNHRTAARRNTNWPIYRHFTQPKHDFDRDHRVIILESTRKDQLLEKEKEWIRKLDTTLPNGLNSQWSIL